MIYRTKQRVATSPLTPLVLHSSHDAALSTVDHAKDLEAVDRLRNYTGKVSCSAFRRGRGLSQQELLLCPPAGKGLLVGVPSVRLRIRAQAYVPVIGSR